MDQMKSGYPDFEAIFLSFARVIWKAYAALQDGHQTEYRKHVRTFDEQHPFITVCSYPIQNYIDRQRIQELLHEPEVQSCIKEHRLVNLPNWVQIEPDAPYDQYAWYTFQQLNSLVVGVLEENGNLDRFPSRRIKSLYRKHFRFWTAASYSESLFFPVYGINIDKKLSFGELISLQPFSPKLKSELYLLVREFGPSVKDFLDAATVLVIKSQFIKGTRPKDHDRITHQEISGLIAALRLTTGLELGLRNGFRISSAPKPQMVSAPYAECPLETRAIEYCPTQTLRSTDFREARRLFKLVRQTPNNEQIARSIRRFNLAYSRDQVEDRILDLTIAIESLLVSADSELTFQLKLFGSHLLAEKQAIERTKRDLGLLYSLRSAIVHSGMIIGSPKGKQHKKLLRDLQEGGSWREGILKISATVRLVLATIVELAADGSSINTIQDDLKLMAFGEDPSCTKLRKR